MISGTTANSCFPSGPQGLSIYGVSEDFVSSSIEQQSTAATNSDPHSASSTNFLYNLSVLKDKVHQVQSLASMFISSDHSQPSQSTAIAIASMGTLIQEIIVTASSMMFTYQQITVGVGGSTAPSSNNHCTNNNSHQLQQQHPQLDHVHHHRRLKLPDGPGAVVHGENGGGGNRVLHFGEERGQGTFFSNSEALDQWYGDSYNNCTNANDNTTTRASSVTVVSNPNEVERGEFSAKKGEKNKGLGRFSPKNYDIVELDAADLLAKYTHYCQVCGKGFKRDANLRMHMRAHGDEYKSSAALSNPHKSGSCGNGKEEGGSPKLPRKYSCPHEGCRWNKKHAKFQPLKSMICVKNHYKRSHCPKMYVCKRCNKKQFSVLSDLRTHEKHCGDLKWQCSCGTTFSRKDKLMGHVVLFAGHTPALSSLAKMGKADPNPGQMQLEDR